MQVPNTSQALAAFMKPDPATYGYEDVRAPEDYNVGGVSLTNWQVLSRPSGGQTPQRWVFMACWEIGQEKVDVVIKAGSKDRIDYEVYFDYWTLLRFCVGQPLAAMAASVVCTHCQTKLPADLSVVIITILVCADTGSHVQETRGRSGFTKVADHTSNSTTSRIRQLHPFLCHGAVHAYQ